MLWILNRSVSAGTYNGYLQLAFFFLENYPRIIIKYSFLNKSSENICIMSSAGM